MATRFGSIPLTFCLLCAVGCVAAQSEDTCVYSFLVPGENNNAACSDSVSLDQQLFKTMVLSLQMQVTQQQDLLRQVTTGLIPGELMAKRNLRQCSYEDLYDGREDGMIGECLLRKAVDDTVLRVVWNGNIRLRKNTGTTACRRWFFTINGKECDEPAAIDTQLYEADSSSHHHRSAYLEGLCRNIPAGALRVAFNVGDCLSMSGMHKGDAATGWGSTSRIIVEELYVIEPGLVL